MRRLFFLLVALALPGYAAAQPPSQSQLSDLKRLSIEELAETDVTGSGRRPEQLDRVAAAVTVITSDDLRRHGALTLPDALRLAEFLHVAQVNGPGYAISARGFNISTANKLLVMIDGRTVYSPVYSGVFWDAQDLIIHDIERIEVVRGPGGTLWGANAMNGVIHIITKNAADTKGTFVSAAIGSSSTGPIGIRHGGRFGAAGSYRIYGKVREDAAATLLSGGSAGNEHAFGQSGFRIESGRTGNSFAVLQGDVFAGDTGVVLDVDRSTRSRGGNLLGRWTRRGNGGTETTVQAYYDYFYRRVPDQYRGVLHTLDVDAQHQRAFPRTIVVVGGGYRHYRGDDLGDGPGFFFDPRQRVSHRSNVFAQAELALTPELFVTAGVKLERNEFTGVEPQPSLAGRWSRGASTIWATASRAVRVPTRIDTDLRLRDPNTSLVSLTGSEDFRSETLMAIEAGYRTRFGQRASLEIAAYNNRYDDLRSQEAQAPPMPIRLMNLGNAVTRGLEISGRLQLAPWWQASGGYTRFWKTWTFDPGSTDRTGGAAEGNDPKHMLKLRSVIDIGSRLELDSVLRYIGALPAPAVEAYTELDVRLGYRIRAGWDVALIGDSLLHPNHLEFRGTTPPQVYKRSVTVRTTWRY
jgi:iron complex outermembrane recepter protein